MSKITQQLSELSENITERQADGRKNVGVCVTMRTSLIFALLPFWRNCLSGLEAKVPGY
jgi:hypothetical protein